MPTPMGGVESVIIPEIPIGQIVSGQIVAKNVTFIPNRGGMPFDPYDQYRPPIATPEQQLPEKPEVPIRPLPLPNPIDEVKRGNMIAPPDFKMPKSFPAGSMAVIMGDTFSATLDPYQLPDALNKGYSLIGIFDAATADRIVDEFTKNPPPNPAKSLEKAITATAKLNIIGQVVGLSYADVFAKMNDNLVKAGGVGGIGNTFKPDYKGYLKPEYPTTASFAIEVVGMPDINELVAPVEKYLLDGFGNTLTFAIKSLSDERAVNDWVKGQNSAAANSTDNYVMLTPMPETRGFGEVMGKPVSQMSADEKVDLANQYMDLTNQFQYAVSAGDVQMQDAIVRKIETINQQAGVPSGCAPTNPTSLPPDLTPKGCTPKPPEVRAKQPDEPDQPTPDPNDNDGDGVPDDRDTDDDNDGIPDDQDTDDDGDGKDDESGYNGGDSPRLGMSQGKLGGQTGTTPPYDPNRDYWEESKRRNEEMQRKHDRESREAWERGRQRSLGR